MLHKVDADMIKKELKRKSPSISDEGHDRGSDDDSSSNESISEDSEDDLQMRSHKHGGFSSRRKTIHHSSGSESDCPHSQQRWSGDGAIFATNKPCDNTLTSTGPAPPSATLLLKQQRNPAVFGVSPYNVRYSIT